jgi:protein-arginine kinase activator protein McsA
MDGLSTRDFEILERREVLSDFTSRDLIEELSDRLERRGNSNSSKKKKTYGCPYCGKQYDTFDKVSSSLACYWLL